MFSKGVKTSWSHYLWKVTEIINDTIPSYDLNKLPEKYNEAFLKKKTILTLKENNSQEKFKIILNQNAAVYHY